jgi:hypothetical protein
MFGETGLVLESTLDAMRENLSTLKQLGESLELIKKAVTENYTATNDNNERVGKLLTKVEAYFAPPASITITERNRMSVSEPPVVAGGPHSLSIRSAEEIGPRGLPPHSAESLRRSVPPLLIILSE